MRGTNLGEFEELLLLVVMILQEEAYVLRIRDEIKEQRRLARKEGSEYIPRDVPHLPPFSSDQAEYLIFEDQTALDEQEAVLKPLDAMHVFFDQNEETLCIEQQRAMALREARQRYEEAHPEAPEDTVINFWPVRGSAYLESNR